MSVNKVFLIGRLGSDAELRFTQSGKAVVSFSLATDDGTKENPVVNWHKVEKWNAESLHPYLEKGKMVAVEGRINYHRYEDKTYTTIIASKIDLLCGVNKVLIPQSQEEPDDVPF